MFLLHILCLRHKQGILSVSPITLGYTAWCSDELPKPYIFSDWHQPCVFMQHIPICLTCKKCFMTSFCQFPDRTQLKLFVQLVPNFQQPTNVSFMCWEMTNKRHLLELVEEASHSVVWYDNLNESASAIHVHLVSSYSAGSQCITKAGTCWINLVILTQVCLKMKPQHKHYSWIKSGQTQHKVHMV